MKRLFYSMLASFVLCSAVTACSPERQRDDSTVIAKVRSWEIYRVGPDQYGVACYKMRGVDSITCIKVQ